MANTGLSAWHDYYVIVGSSGAALIGIQFVVITLIGQRPEPAPAETVQAFGTPTVVHFASALLVSAIMAAPWPSLFGPALALGVCGIAGLAYSLLVTYRARRQTGYEPVAEDWLWYSIVPLLLYASLAISALFLWKTEAADFSVAATALGFLFIGINNAWDTVTHLVVTGTGEPKVASPTPPTSPTPPHPAP